MARTSKAVAALLLLAVAAGGATAATDPSEGSSCVLKSGGAGTCRPLADCPAAKAALVKGVTPTICAFNGSALVVCCPPKPAPGLRATKMCEKFAEAVFVWEALPLVTVETQYGRIDSCQMKNDTPAHPSATAEPNEFPHMALLGYRYEKQPKVMWKCGGSLISERYVLTTARCITGSSSNEKLSVVRLGEFNNSEDEERDNVQEDFGIEKIIPHPDYTSGKLDHNVGLIKLDRDVNFTRFYRPACLYTLPAVLDRKATVTGWGLIDYYAASILLKKYPLNLLRSEECDAAYDGDTALGNGFDDKNMICAENAVGGPCLGDAGGPMQTKHRTLYCMYNLIGIINFSRSCNNPQNPLVMARVSHYVPWIESVVWSDWSADI